MRKSLLIILITCCTFFTSFAQKVDIKTEASNSFDAKNYKQSYELYDKLYSESPSNALYKSRLAISALYYPERKTRALELFEDIKKTQKMDDIDYYLGKAYHINYKFDEAITSYQAFLTQKGEKVKDRDKEFVRS